MKRRTFLTGLLVAPAVALGVSKTANKPAAYIDPAEFDAAMRRHWTHAQLQPLHRAGLHTHVPLPELVPVEVRVVEHKYDDDGLWLRTIAHPTKKTPRS